MNVRPIVFLILVTAACAGAIIYLGSAIVRGSRPPENELVGVYGRVTPRPKTLEEHDAEIQRAVDATPAPLTMADYLQFKECHFDDAGNLTLTAAEGGVIVMMKPEMGPSTRHWIGEVANIKGPLPSSDQTIGPGTHLYVIQMRGGPGCRATTK